MSAKKDDSKARVICMMCKYYEKGLFNLMVCPKCCHYIEYNVEYVPYRIECPEKDKPASDPVNHPSHYTDGKIEVADYIADKNFNFFLGNAIKYISRAGKKDPDKYVEDLQKAIWYLKKEIDMHD